MSTTIIDALLVTFGLDATQYTKAQKDAAKSLIETGRKNKQVTADIGKQFDDLGRNVLAMFLGFESATGFVKFLGGLNKGEADLGRFAHNIGMNVHEVNRWGLALELNGGKAEDAQAAFQKITQEFSQQQVTGQTGPLLTFLRARGVSILDANNKLRNQGEILEELADKTAQYGRVYQATMFRNAGLSEGEINYLTMEKSARQELLALAEKNNRVNEDAVKQAAKLQAQWASVGQTAKAMGQSLLDWVGKGMEHADDWFKKIEADKQKAAKPAPSGSVLDKPGAPAGGFWSEFTKGVGNAVKYANKEGSREVDPVQKADLLSKIAATEAALGIPGGLLARIAQQESHFRPDIISGQTRSSAGAVGLMQLMPGVFKGAATMSPEQQIAVAGGELVKLHNRFKDWTLAVEAYNDGQGNVNSSLHGGHKLPAETLAYASKVMSGPTPGAGGGGGGNHSIDVDVGQITIIPPVGASPAAIAMMVPEAITRKMSVGQAGMGQS